MSMYQKETADSHDLDIIYAARWLLTLIAVYI